MANIVDLLQQQLHAYLTVHSKKKPPAPSPTWRPTIPREAPEPVEQQDEIVSLLESLAPPQRPEG